MNDGAKEIHALNSDFNTAKSQWDLYVARLALGYDNAFKEHKDVLDRMHLLRTLDAQREQRVLMAICTGFAGGFVGGMLAPWIQEAGRATAQALMRTVAVETVKEIVKTTSKEIFMAVQGSAAYSAYTPQVSDTTSTYLRMLVELGNCFSHCRDQLEEWEKKAERERWTKEQGAAKAAQIAGIPLLTQYPRTKDMPDPREVARSAEIAMWIAWGVARPFAYWSSRKQSLLFGANYYYPHHMFPRGAVHKFQELDPILKRIEVLSWAAYQHVRFQTNSAPKWMLDPLSLPELATVLPGSMFSKIETLAKSSDPGGILSTMNADPAFAQSAPTVLRGVAFVGAITHSRLYQVLEL